MLFLVGMFTRGHYIEGFDPPACIRSAQKTTHPYQPDQPLWNTISIVNQDYSLSTKMTQYSINRGIPWSFANTKPKKSPSLTMTNHWFARWWPRTSFGHCESGAAVVDRAMLDGKLVQVHLLVFLCGFLVCFYMVSSDLVKRHRFFLQCCRYPLWSQGWWGQWWQYMLMICQQT